VRNALKGGYLADESSKDERGMKLVLGAALPGAADSYLPAVAAIVQVMSGGRPDDANPHEDEASGALSGRPASPVGTGLDDDELAWFGTAPLDDLIAHYEEGGAA
jgi:hypothetical protein